MISQDGSSCVDAWVGCGSVASGHESFARFALPPGNNAN